MYIGKNIYSAGAWHKFDNALGSSQIRLYNDAHGIEFYTGTPTETSPGTVKMVIKDDGKVGIGTNNPQTNLQIEATTDPTITIKSKTGNSEMRLMAVNSNGTSEAQIQYKGILRFVEPISGTHRMTINADGKVGIGGDPNPDYKLHVQGKLRACEVFIENTGWCDFVFDENYNLMSLNEVDIYLKKNKHLLDVASAKSMEIAGGRNLGESQQDMMKKSKNCICMLFNLTTKLHFWKMKMKN